MRVSVCRRKAQDGWVVAVSDALPVEAAERAARTESSFHARFTIGCAADGVLAFYEHALSATR
jgi:hypothetical protein